MSRPNFLIAEPEPPESLSARKLVVETAKFNVLTAYSGRETIQLLRDFPNLSALILHSGLEDIPCESLVRLARQIKPDLPIILLAAHMGRRCEGVDHCLSSHSPDDLLSLLRQLFGDPRAPEHQPAPAQPLPPTGTE